MRYLSQIITEKELSSIEKGKFNILKAPRGSGKTTFMFDERVLRLASSKRRVIYLIHNKQTRDFIAARHSDKAKVYDEIEDFIEKEPEQKVQVMCYQTFAAIIRKEPSFLDRIDFIIWDEFDDIRGYLVQEVRELKKKLPQFGTERILALLEEGNNKSVASFVYKIKTLILDPAKITLLAVSATPDLAASIFTNYINDIFEGKIENAYAAQQTLYIESVIAALKNGLIKPGVCKFWCYTQYIRDILRIEEIAKQQGFKTIALWNRDNTKYKKLWNEEKDNALSSIVEGGIIPEQYDFVIANDVIGRGVDVLDNTYQDWICNSTVYESVGQFIRARFSPSRQYLLMKMKDENQVPDLKYYEWHTVSEMRQFIAAQPLYDLRGKPYTSWNAFVKENADLIEKRKYGKKQETQYRLRLP